MFLGSQCGWKGNLLGITKYREATFGPKDASGGREPGGAEPWQSITLGAPLAGQPAASHSRRAAVPAGMLCSRPTRPLVLVTAQ